MQNKRFFAFGCSYTDYSWPTWADIIGINFSFYKNYGKAGCSNLYILQKFLEAHDKYNFNQDDVIVVMLTGIARFTYTEYGKVTTHGELRNYFQNTKDKSVGMFLDSGIWSEDLGASHSFISIKTIKNLLSSINCTYKLVTAIDNTDFVNNPHKYFFTEESLVFVEKFYDTLDNRLSMDEWMKSRYKRTEYYKFDGDYVDGHPTIQMHEEYVKEYFPEYYTSLSQQFTEREKNCFIFTDQHTQGTYYNNRKIALNYFSKEYYD